MRHRSLIFLKVLAVKFFVDSPINVVLLLTALVCAVMLAMPALLRRGAAALSILEATQLINRKNAVLLDLRDTEQFAQGHALNARNVPANTLPEATSALPKNKAAPLLLLCESGQRSAAGARLLSKQGYTEVYTLAGGHNAWVAAGLPVQK